MKFEINTDRMAIEAKYITHTPYNGVLVVSLYANGMTIILRMMFEGNYDAILKGFEEKRRKCRLPKDSERYGRVSYDELIDKIKNRPLRKSEKRNEIGVISQETVKRLMADIRLAAKRKKMPEERIFHKNTKHFGLGFKGIDLPTYN